jgi:hypothetical protein
MDHTTTCSGHDHDHDHDVDGDDFNSMGGDNKKEENGSYDKQLLVLPTRSLSQSWANGFHCLLAIISFTRNGSVTIGEWLQLDISLPSPNNKIIGICGVMNG